MKTIKHTFMFLFLAIYGISTAQEYEVPKDVKLDKAEDYVKYKPAVLKAIYWLENTPVQQEEAKRQATSSFLMKYMSGAPDFSIMIMPFQMDLVEKNPDLLMSFLGGWTRFALENPSLKDNAVMANKAGIQSLLKVYDMNKSKGMKKDNKVEKLVKMNDAALEKWITSKLGNF